MQQLQTEKTLTLMYFLYFLLAGRSACLCCLAQSAENYLIPTTEKRNTQIEETRFKKSLWFIGKQK